MIVFLQTYWMWLVPCTFLLAYLFTEGVLKRRDKMPLWRRMSLSLKRTVRPYLPILFIELLLILLFILAVTYISAHYDKSICKVLNLTAAERKPSEVLPNDDVVPFGIILAITAAVLTAFGARLSYKVWRHLTAELQSVDNLLKEVNDYLLDICALDPSDVQYLRPSFYMYLKTPSLGNISASRTRYDNFRTNLDSAKKKGTDVRIICLKEEQYEEFHKSLFASPPAIPLTAEQNEKVAMWTKQAKDLKRELSGAIKERSHIFNGFFVVTDAVAYQFSVKAREGNGHHDIVGRVIKNPSDVKFIRDSFIQSWNEL